MRQGALPTPTRGRHPTCTFHPPRPAFPSPSPSAHPHPLSACLAHPTGSAVELEHHSELFVAVYVLDALVEQIDENDVDYGYAAWFDASQPERRVKPQPGPSDLPAWPSGAGDGE